MIRLTTVNDAEQLNVLNNEFNGKGETTIENIKTALPLTVRKLLSLMITAG